MGLFSPVWQDKDTKKAMGAVAALGTDGALFRAAKGAREEAVALFAVSRIKDVLRLERLALSEPRVSMRIAGMALQRIAEHRQEFSAILQRLDCEGNEGDASRVTALLSAAMDITEDPAAFARMLATLARKERNAYLKRCGKDDDFLSGVLLHCVGIFSRSMPEVSAMMWRFSDKTILKTLGMLDDMGVTLSDSVPAVVQGLRTREAVLEAASTAKAVRARRMALKRIDDQPTLLSIALHNDSDTIRLEAAGRLNERADMIEFINAYPYDVTEALLQKAIRPAPNGGRRGKKPASTPVASLSQEQLLEVAIKSYDNKARKKAVSLITDSSDLNLYARHHMSELDEKTVMRLTSQPLLAELACDKYRYQQPVRMAAVSRLTEDERLGQVVWEHTQSAQSEDERQLVTAALSKIRNQDIIYQAMGLADGLKTRISAEALNYITDTAILLKVALGGSRFAKKAAEQIADEAALREIVRGTRPADEAYGVAYKKLEAMRIAALAEADGDTLKEAALHDESMDVRVAAVERITDQDFLKALVLADDEDEGLLLARAAAVKRIEDQKFIEMIALDDKRTSLHAAAARRLTRWEVLLEMVSRNSVYIKLAAELLCSDTFAGERDAIVAAAAPYLRQGDEAAALRFAAIITGLTGENEKDVCIRYGGREFMQMQIENLLHRTELNKFKETLNFLRYAYGRSEHYREKLAMLGGRSVSLHYDFNSSCVSESCNVTVEETIDFKGA